MTQIASPVSARSIGGYFSVNVSLGRVFEPIIPRSSRPYWKDMARFSLLDRTNADVAKTERMERMKERPHPSGRQARNPLDRRRPICHGDFAATLS
jgi:hypothetical protein